MNRRQLSGSTCLALFLLSLWSSASVAEHRRVSGFVDDLTLDRFGMTRRWYSQVPTLRLRERVLSLKQIENLLFAASDKGQLHCLESETGKLLWSQDVSNTPGEVFPPAITEKYVYVCSGSRLTQLDRATGQVIQSSSLPAAATSGPAANENFCYVQTINNFIYAIALKPSLDEEGKKWPYKRKYSLPYVAWFFNAGSPLFNPPILTNDRVIFAGQNGVVFASSLSQRNLYYRFITNAKLTAPISRRQRTFYVATEDYNLYAVNVKGNLEWRFASGFPISRQPVPFETDIFLTPDGAGLMCVSQSEGKLRWINESARQVIGASQNRVYAMTSTMRFLIIDRADGTTVGSWFSPDFPIVAYNQTTDRLFQATERGLIQCLAERENITPFFHESISPPTDDESAPPAPAEDAPESDEPAPASPRISPPDEDPPAADDKMESDEPGKTDDDASPAEPAEEPAEEAPEKESPDAEEMPEETPPADKAK
ncbi:PQQ-like beta-propeller repeat protein [bacterium]|nr:PQQ-like beta-propeller repeat protein [bacterium]